MVADPAQFVEVTRYDRAGGVLAPRVTDEGFLLCQADFAKPGVLQYRHRDGSITRELVLPEELHNPASLATLAFKPVTLEHPSQNVTPETHADTAVGSVGETVEVQEEGGYARVRLVVRDRAAIDAIRGGKREVSPGYRVQLDATPGVHPVYGEYDAVQRGRVYNHLAITDVARGGPTIRLHLDAACMIGDDGGNPTQESAMNRALFLALLAAAAVPADQVVKADAADTDPVSDEEITRFGEAITAKQDSAGLKAAFDALMGQYNGMSRTMAQKDAEIAALKGEVAKMKADMCGPKPMEEEMDKGDGLKAAVAWTGRRSSLMALAASRGITVENADSLGNRDLARKIASSVRSDLRADASDDYVAAVIDLATAEPARPVDPYAGLTFRGDSGRAQADADAGERGDSLSEISLAAYSRAAGSRS